MIRSLALDTNLLMVYSGDGCNRRVVDRLDRPSLSRRAGLCLRIKHHLPLVLERARQFRCRRRPQLGLMRRKR